ncbi:hypothetical protein M0R89_10155 [Halorussus limi]|uniref:Uncharacterized protein n=1 Tax=Halorussus limi TaxID=2938695 RepID=A0A8U0HPX7_9EURY|nr:hypothetical protein [Halorussus limi]UPV72911.1 hypothetical protein M0R89_10155 [Halorussus limi]
MDARSLQQQVREASTISEYRRAVSDIRRYIAEVEPTTTDAGGAPPIQLVDTAKETLRDCDSAEEFRLEGQLIRALGLVANDE